MTKERVQLLRDAADDCHAEANNLLNQAPNMGPTKERSYRREADECLKRAADLRAWANELEQGEPPAPPMHRYTIPGPYAPLGSDPPPPPAMMMPGNFKGPVRYIGQNEPTAPQGWQPIFTVPKDRPVLLWSDSSFFDNRKTRCFVGNWTGEHGLWSFPGVGGLTAKYWQELPVSPENRRGD